MSEIQLGLTTASVFLAIIILCIQVWVNFGRQWWRNRKMRCPFDAAFIYVEAPSNEKELHLPQNCEVQINLTIFPKLHYTQHEIIVGFVRPDPNNPIMKSYQNKFIQRGKGRTIDPDDDLRHYVDYNGAYHIRDRAERTTGNNYTLGFIVETKAAGRFPLHIDAMTDTGEGNCMSQLVLVVD